MTNCDTINSFYTISKDNDRNIFKYLKKRKGHDNNNNPSKISKLR